MSSPPRFGHGMPAQTAMFTAMPGASGWFPAVSAIQPGAPWRRHLLAALVLTLPVTTFITVSDKKANLALSDVILLASTAFLLWHALDADIRLPLAPVCCLNICSTILSILANREDFFANRSVATAAVEVLKISSLWAYFYLGVNLVRTRHDLLLLLRVWIAVTVLVALSGVAGSLAYQYAGIQTPFSLMFRAQGTLGDSNIFAAHLLLTTALTLFYGRLTGGLKCWAIAAILLNLTGVLFAASRGGMMTAIVGSVFLWTRSRSWRARIGGLIGMILLSLLFVLLPDRDAVLSSNPLTARLSDIKTPNDDAAADRRGLWATAADRFVETPFFGIGRGNFGGQVHNTYLEILCETGVLGFTTYVAFLIPVLWGLIRRSLPGSQFLAAGIFVIGIAGLTISIENYRGIWVLLGATVALTQNY